MTLTLIANLGTESAKVSLNFNTTEDEPLVFL